MRNLGQTLVRHGYSATFIKVDSYGKYALLYTIMDERHITICDHVWVKVGKWNSRLGPGDVFEFTAVPIKYVKRNQNTTNQLEVDITLSEIKNVKKTGSFEIHHKEMNIAEETLE